MAATEDSTTDTSGYSDGERQGLVNSYVTLMLQAIQEDPWIAQPDLMDFLIWAEPLHSTGQLVRKLRGRQLFRITVDRLTVVRTAALRDEIAGVTVPEGKRAGFRKGVPKNPAGSTPLEGLPVSTRIPEGGHAGETVPADGDFIGWWPPQVIGEGPAFPTRAIRVEGGIIQSYPRGGTGAGDFSQDEVTDAKSEEGNNCTRRQRRLMAGATTDRVSEAAQVSHQGHTCLSPSPVSPWCR